jgi:hypothetical protein
MAEFKFFCPRCGQNVQCDTGYSGTQINCPACQQAIVVPQPPPDAGATPAPAKSQTLRNILVIAASLIVLVGLVTAGWLGYSKIRVHIKAGQRPTGLVALWSGEGNANDIVNGNNGTPMGALSYANGEVGQAFVFNASTSYISVPASPSLNLGTNGGFTIECWIKPSAFNAVVGNGGPLIEWDSASVDGVNLWAVGGNILSSVIHDTSGNVHAFQSANGLLVTNTFQQVALTYDKSSGQAVIYWNGIVAATSNFGNFTPQTTYPVNIGRRTGEPIGNGDNYNGLIDELSLYNRALSAAEIQAIYKGQK